MNSDLELDLMTPSPGAISAYDVNRSSIKINIGFHPNNGSFYAIGVEGLSSIELYYASGNRRNTIIVSVEGSNYQITTGGKALVVVVAKLNKGGQVAKKVIIY